MMSPKVTKSICGGPLSESKAHTLNLLCHFIKDLQQKHIVTNEPERRKMQLICLGVLEVSKEDEARFYC